MIGVQVNTLQEEAIIHITKLIINGGLKLGQRINEVELSQMLNMSRGPIRESLRILNQQGLLTYEPRRGMFVTNITKEDIKEIYDIRLALEKSAVELGFGNLTNKHISEMRFIVDRIYEYSKADRRDVLVKLDADFHEAIVSLPKYKRLVNTWRSYNALLALAFAKIFELGTESAEDLLERHHYLVDILDQRDKELFLQALTEHYEDGKNKLLEVWDTF